MYAAEQRVEISRSGGPRPRGGGGGGGYGGGGGGYSGGGGGGSSYPSRGRRCDIVHKAAADCTLVSFVAEHRVLCGSPARSPPRERRRSPSYDRGGRRSPSPVRRRRSPSYDGAARSVSPRRERCCSLPQPYTGLHMASDPCIPCLFALWQLAVASCVLSRVSQVVQLTHTHSAERQTYV